MKRPAFSPSKFALEAVTDSLRVELRPWGISVSIVEPGDVATPMWEKGLAVVDEIVKKFPPQALELYGPVRDVRERFKPHGIPPDQVARAVEHALLARSPKACYLVGRDARILSVIRRLPVGIRDWLIARQLPTYG